MTRAGLGFPDAPLAWTGPNATALPGTALPGTGAFAIALIGRDAERGSIERALERGGDKALIATGPPGIGKSFLLATILARRRAGGALTGAGKHVQGDSGDELAPLISALEGAVTVGLDSLYDPEAGLSSLRELLGMGGAVLAALGAGPLRRLSAKQAPNALPLAAAEERLAHAIITVLRWLHGFNQPILLLLDDWGRASARVAALYRRLVADPDLHRLTILASERDGEALVGVAAPRFALAPLSSDEQLRLLEGLLGDARALSRDVAHTFRVWPATPLDLIDEMRRIADSGAIRSVGGGWTFDRDMALTAADREVSAASRVGAGPPMTLAQTLSLFGDAAERGDLFAGADLGHDEAEAALRDLQRAGIVIVDADIVRFTHDRVRAGVTALASQTERRRGAARVAEGLRRIGADADFGGRGLVMLWRRLDAGLEDADAALWSHLFLQGALAARRRGDSAGANDFAEAALALCERRGLVTHPVLAAASLAALENGRHTLALDRVNRMQAVAQTPQERAEADELRVHVLRMTGDVMGAIDAARDGLRRVGIAIPAAGSWVDAFLAVARVWLTSPAWASRQRALTDEDLAVQAPMMRAINALGGLIFEQSSARGVSFAARSIPPRLAAGSAAGAAGYAVICANLGAFRRAAAWGDISDNRQGPGQPLRATAMLYATNSGRLAVRPRWEISARRAALENLGFEHGELSVALYASRDRVQDALFLDIPLAETRQIAIRAHDMASRLRDPVIGAGIAAMRQIVENLISGGAAPWRLEGPFFDQTLLVTLSDAAMDNAKRGLGGLEAMLGVAFGAYDHVARYYDATSALFARAENQELTQSWTFATSLALYRMGRRPEPRRLAALARFARMNPANHAHRRLLLAAERARLEGRPRDALDLYDRTLEAAAAARCWIELGVAASAAAEAAAMMGAVDAQARWRDAAARAWTSLGAKAVLERRGGRRTAEEGDAPALRTALAEREQEAALRLRELDAAREAAERANVAKSKLLIAVGHELRTPLHGMRGLLDLASGAGESLDMPAVRGALDHLTAVVSDLTDLGALDAGLAVLNEEPFDPCELVRGVANAHRSVGSRAIIMHAPRTCPPALGDRARLRQILVNLVANAERHGRGDITLTLETHTADASLTLSICVDDEGPGIPEYERARLFEPFERGATDNADGGMGLGLAIARRWALALGGELVVESAPAGGARFRLALTLPLADASEAGSRASAEGARATGVRVLLAEDEPLSRRVVARMLRAAGAEVWEVSDGEQALAALRVGAFDLALLDVRMPGRGGVAVAEALMEDDHAPRVALMSATIDQGLAIAAARTHALVLAKPFGRSEIQRLLTQTALAGEPVAAVDRLHRLRSMLGREAPAIFAQVRGQVCAIGRDIDAAALQRDAPTVSFLAHRLSGMAAHFGLEAISAAATTLQQRAERGDETAGQLATLSRAIDAADWSRFEPAEPPGEPTSIRES